MAHGHTAQLLKDPHHVFVGQIAEALHFLEGRQRQFMPLIVGNFTACILHQHVLQFECLQARRVAQSTVTVSPIRQLKGSDVRDFLARSDCRIHLIQLPPYCPHLNPIERLWAVMHQCVTHNRHYSTQKQFANAILRFFRETLPKEWKTFQTQVSDNFRVVTHEKFRVLG